VVIETHKTIFSVGVRATIKSLSKLLLSVSESKTVIVFLGHVVLHFALVSVEVFRPVANAGLVRIFGATG